MTNHCHLIVQQSRQLMSSLRTHFEERAVKLADRASFEAVEQDGAVTVRLRPHAPTAVGVVLYLYAEKVGTVTLDDPGCVPTELGDGTNGDRVAIDYFIDVAVEGRAKAFHLGRGGCIEIRELGGTTRSWNKALPWPGWRRRAEHVSYGPYA